MSETTALIRAAKAYEAIPDFKHFALLHIAAFMFWHRWQSRIWEGEVTDDS